METSKLLTWCEVDRNALVHNARAVKAILPPGCHLAPVVKANGYGHGMIIASRAFLDGGARWLCVETAEDGLHLRAHLVNAPMYVIGSIPRNEDAMREAIAAGMRFSVGSYHDVDEISLAVSGSPDIGRATVHLKWDTGFGVGQSYEEAQKLVGYIHCRLGLRLEGISTHYADANDNREQAEGQLKEHNRFCDWVERTTIHRGEIVRHCTNSASVLRQLSQKEDLARVGIALYGIWESLALRAAMVASGNVPLLKPALTWKTRITSTKSVPAGTGIGYGSSFRTTRESVIGVIPVGYSDGLDRRLSNTGSVMLPGGHEAPIVGRVCMNMAFVDLTGAKDGVGVGCEVAIIGRVAGAPYVLPEHLARLCNTIPQEIVTRIAAHIPRVEV